MYQGDNLHLATTGALRLSWGVIAHLGTLIDLSATQAQPPPDESAPPEVVERTEQPVPNVDTGA